jgi:hypothetical protein
MLGAIAARGDGQADRLMAAVADALHAEGLRVAGAVQRTRPRRGAQAAPAMVLSFLDGSGTASISQDLGPGAQGCRLDPGALEAAVARVERMLAARPALLVVNRFGKQEALGRGFRPLIGAALAEGFPVLLAVGAAHRAAFEAFAGGLATPLPEDEAAVLDWARAHAAG